MLIIHINKHSIDKLYDLDFMCAIIERITWRKIGNPQFTKFVYLIAYSDKPVSALGKTCIEMEAFEREITKRYVTK